MNEFQENILDHYKNPRNFGKPEWIATSSCESKNVSCGDEITIYVKTDSNTLKNIAFEGEGCSIAIASASIISDEFKNTPVDEIRQLDEETYLKTYIGIDLTTERKKCALLAFEALKTALI